LLGALSNRHARSRRLGASPDCAHSGRPHASVGLPIGPPADRSVSRGASALWQWLAARLTSTYRRGESTGVVDWRARAARPESRQFAQNSSSAVGTPAARSRARSADVASFAPHRAHGPSETVRSGRLPRRSSAMSRPWLRRSARSGQATTQAPQPAQVVGAKLRSAACYYLLTSTAMTAA
jgi:hypothetical protein